jgi:predicted transposase YdaD
MSARRQSCLPVKVSNQLASIHDRFFKQTLSDLDLARTFLREHLPQEIASLLAPGQPEVVSGSFVDEELRQHYSDVLFRVQLKSGSDAFAYVLVEHKSVPDPIARLQLLRYVVRVLINWYKQNGKQLPLPAVVPLLAHQGPENWEISCEFADLFGVVPEALCPYLPSFRHALVDLAGKDGWALSTEVRLRAYLKALKYGRRADLPERLDIVLAEARALCREDLNRIVTYFDRGPIPLSSEAFDKALQQVDPERKEEIMGWITQPYVEKAMAQGIAQGMAQGLAEGLAEGKAQGRAEGEANSLLRLLEKRFGAIPTHTKQRIFAADLASIQEWSDRAIDAPDVDSVLAPK